MTKFFYQAVVNDGVPIGYPKETMKEAVKELRNGIKADLNEGGEEFIRYNEYFIEKVKETTTTTTLIMQTRFIPIIGPKGGITFRQKRIY